MKLTLKRTEPKTEDVEIPVEITNIQWSGRAAYGHQANLTCGICHQPIGKRLYVVAYARVGDAPKASPMRLCEDCGKKAEV